MQRRMRSTAPEPGRSRAHTILFQYFFSSLDMPWRFRSFLQQHLCAIRIMQYGVCRGNVAFSCPRYVRAYMESHSIIRSEQSILVAAEDEAGDDRESNKDEKRDLGKAVEVKLQGASAGRDRHASQKCVNSHKRQQWPKFRLAACTLQTSLSCSSMARRAHIRRSLGGYCTSAHTAEFG